MAISIHAPREGGDLVFLEIFHSSTDFNPRPPRGGRRVEQTHSISIQHFNPRPPRGGRLRRGRLSWSAFDFNPRPPRGGRLRLQLSLRGLLLISIHAPREGGDSAGSMRSRHRVVFQSTPPARGATMPVQAVQGEVLHFNPRPPRGGRPVTFMDALASEDFNPRPPRGGRRVSVFSWE